MPRLKRILVPVDYSATSQLALRFAATLASPLGASVEVMHVCEYPLQTPGEITVIQAGERRPLSALLLENAEREMKEFLDSAELPRGLVLHRLLTYGEPKQEILRRVQAGEFDLVVVGTHGRTGFQHFLLGSVAETVVRLSPAPVVAVPARHARQEPA
jgi:nucleotide-binding universal stress UspA family protein